jgi:hypothetical protein
MALRAVATPLSVEVWASETRRLLQLERDEEIAVASNNLLTTDAAVLEAAGTCLLNLRVASSAGAGVRVGSCVVDCKHRGIDACRVAHVAHCCRGTRALGSLRGARGLSACRCAR